VVNPGGLEPPAAGLKVPCPADPGFTLGVRSDPAFERRHVLLHWFQVWCKPVESNHLPLGYRPRPSPFGLACDELVPLQGFEPRISVCKTDALGR
jgi:hypothetical protein